MGEEVKTLEQVVNREVQQHSFRKRLALLTEAALWEGSQLPNRQTEFEGNHDLPKDSAFKANILASFLEIGGLVLLNKYGAHIAATASVPDVVRPYFDAFTNVGLSFASVQTLGSSVNIVARTSYYFVTGKTSQSLWGVRCYLAVADKGLQLAGLDIVPAAKKARVALYDIVESSAASRWLNTRSSLNKHAPRPKGSSLPIVKPTGFIPRYGRAMLERVRSTHEYRSND